MDLNGKDIEKSQLHLSMNMSINASGWKAYFKLLA